MFGRNSLLFSGAIKMLLVSMNSLNAYEPQDNVGMTLAGTPTPTLPVTPRSILPTVVAYPVKILRIAKKRTTFLFSKTRSLLTALPTPAILYCP